MCLRSVPLEDECNMPSKQFLDNENKLIFVRLMRDKL